MSFVGKMTGALLRPYHERQARGRSLSELIRALEASADTVTGRIARAADTPENRDAANHVLGIEGWGQQHLRAPLGEALPLDGYRPYRLPDDTPIAQLAESFAERRRATVALAGELEAAGVDPETRVRHKDLGELTLAGWLAYLDGHAARESRYRLRG